MDIIACGSRPSRKVGPPSFTGTVWQDPIIQALDPAILRAAWVHFEPGARTPLYSHPLGQTLRGVFFCALEVMRFLETYLAGMFYASLPLGIVTSPGSTVLFTGKQRLCRFSGRRQRL